MPATTLTSTNTGRVLAGKYLTFKLHTESYGIELLKVREIIRRTSIISMPQMPAHIRGVINLRGKIIPIMDLRKRFGLAAPDQSGDSCIIVVHVKLSQKTTTQMGLVVDAVEEVVSISPNEFEPPPDFGGRFSADYIVGIAKVKGTVKTLLDIDGIVGSDTPTGSDQFRALSEPHK
jgi:purine-binding chemotaxis protein CheW